jgi:hypothetical protein
VVEGIDSQWDADLMDMATITKDNDGVRYVLVVINIVSRFLWCRPLHTKMGTILVQAFESVFKDRGNRWYYERTEVLSLPTVTYRDF